MTAKLANRPRAGLHRRCAAAGAAVAGLLLAIVPMSAAAAAGPRFFATSACSSPDEGSYRINAFIDGFGPNDAIFTRIALYFPKNKFQFYMDFGYSTDANGAAAIGPFEFPGPSRLGILFFHDRDDSNSYTAGDDVIADQILTIDQPCTGGVAQPK